MMNIISAVVDAVVGFLGLVMIGVIGWAFQLSNRVSVLEAEKSSLKELIMAKFEEVMRRLDKIERMGNSEYQE